MSSELRIGELASAAGVTTDSVPYYERLEILPHPSRTRAGYRIYSQKAIERVRFIKQSQSLGLSLDEIKELLPGRGAGLSECTRVRDLLSAKLADLDVKIAGMRTFRKTLATYIEECEDALSGKRGDRCPVLFEITHREQTTPKRPSGKKGKTE